MPQTQSKGLIDAQPTPARPLNNRWVLEDPEITTGQPIDDLGMTARPSSESTTHVVLTISLGYNPVDQVVRNRRRPSARTRRAESTLLSRERYELITRMFWAVDPRKTMSHDPALKEGS